MRHGVPAPGVARRAGHRLAPDAFGVGEMPMLFEREGEAAEDLAREGVAGGHPRHGAPQGLEHGDLIAQHEAQAMRGLERQHIAGIGLENGFELLGRSAWLAGQPEPQGRDDARLARRDGSRGHRGFGLHQRGGGGAQLVGSCQRQHEQAARGVGKREGGVEFERARQMVGRGRVMRHQRLEGGIPGAQGRGRTERDGRTGQVTEHGVLPSARERGPSGRRAAGRAP
jgi:hypothetical protein